MDQSDFNSLLHQSDSPIVVEFWAPWCGPCKAMAPVLDTVSSAYQDRIRLIKVNADESPELVSHLGVMAIPTLLVYEHGKQTGRHTGGMNAQQIQQVFAAAAAGEKAPIPMGLSGSDRLLRLGAAVILFGLAAFNNFPTVLVIASLAVAFWGVYDRCPIYQAVKARLFGRRNEP